MKIPLLLMLMLFGVLMINGEARQEGEWHVGSSRINVLPPVDGKTDYVIPVTDQQNDENAGTFVKKFDFGVINVGNGSPNAHWVRDVLRVHAMAIGPDPAGKTAVFLTAELYMLFKPDLEAFHARLRQALGDAEYANLIVIVHANHNHQGPDTGGVGLAINHQYFDYLMGQMVTCTLKALDSREPARLYWGRQPFYYGLGDIRDPRLQDANIRVIRAVSLRDPGRYIATMIQWGMHPEITLDYSPPFNISDCKEIVLGGEECTAKGRYFSHDFPGWYSHQLTKLQGGGDALYFNGAIGAQIGNHAPVWEVTPQHPLNDGKHPPIDAKHIPKSFYKAFLIGTALANFTHQIQLEDQPIAFERFDHKKSDFWIRFTNFFFKMGGVPSVGLIPSKFGNRPLFLGDTLRPSWTCHPVTEPSDENCVPDNNAFKFDPKTNYPFRLGTHLKSEVQYLRLGPVQFVTAPLELPPELATGLPSDFDTPEGTLRYYNNPDLHATGADLQLPGVVFQSIPQLPGKSLQFLIGLGGDELGYAVELSDIRMVCQGNQSACEELYQQGAMNYSEPGTFSVAGATCMEVLNHPEESRLRYLQQYGEAAWEMVNSSCTYTKPDGYPRDHYDETNSASMLLARNYIDAVAALFGTIPQGRFCSGDYCDGVGRHECLGCR